MNAEPLGLRRAAHGSSGHQTTPSLPDCTENRVRQPKPLRTREHQYQVVCRRGRRHRADTPADCLCAAMTGRRPCSRCGKLHTPLVHQPTWRQPAHSIAKACKASCYSLCGRTVPLMIYGHPIHGPSRPSITPRAPQSHRDCHVKVLCLWLHEFVFSVALLLLLQQVITEQLSAIGPTEDSITRQLGYSKMANNRVYPETTIADLGPTDWLAAAAFDFVKCASSRQNGSGWGPVGVIAWGERVRPKTLCVRSTPYCAYCAKISLLLNGCRYSLTRTRMDTESSRPPPSLTATRQ